MKKTVIKVISVALVIAMIAVCAGCTQTINVRFVDKDGNDLNLGGGSAVVADTTTPADTTPADTTPADTTPADTTPADTTSPASTPADTQPAATTQPAADTQPAATTQPAAATELSSSSSKEEIVAKYQVVYNTTKATGTFTGTDCMAVADVTLEGKSNDTIKGLIEKFMNSEPSGSYQLPPYTDDNPCKTCLTTADDIETATYTDNGDGTATIKLVPKAETGALRFQGPQGKMFNVMEDVTPTLEKVTVLTWSQGEARDNVKLITEGGYCEVTFNKSTNMMTKAQYVLITKADAVHANVLLFKDKSASATFRYTMAYPVG